MNPPNGFFGSVTLLEGIEGTGTGRGSRFYRIFIIGGLAGIVAAMVLAALGAGEQTRFVMIASLDCLTPFMLVLLGYWRRQFLFEDYGGPGGSAGEGGEAVPDIKALRSWTTLFEAMIVYGGDPGNCPSSSGKAGAP
jgi:hypothetical protein